MREYAAARRRAAEFTLSCRRSAWRRDDADEVDVLQFSPKLNVTWEILLAVDGLDAQYTSLLSDYIWNTNNFGANTFAVGFQNLKN